MMKKLIGIVLIVLLLFSLFGCTNPVTENKIANEADVQKAVSDVGTDLGGISNALDNIDSELVESV